MKKTLKYLSTWGMSGVTVAVTLWASLVTGNWLIFGLATVAVIPFPLLRLIRDRKRRSQAAQPQEKPRVRREPRPKPERPISPIYDTNDPAYLAQRMLEQDRYALLLRPQIAANLRREQLQAAISSLDESMGIVPEGDVLLQSWRHNVHADDGHGQQERLVHVEAIYLDRHPVTNQQFQQFVEDGGYENMSLWDATIWPAVLDFVDRTGHSGPRFWHEGHFADGLEDHPVVGVSWYEGAAFARWAGKRLPSDPEWVKAGCWPVLTQGTRPMQRRYPWGDTMDREVAHLWGSGVNSTVSVYELPGGVNVGGVYHLIGNVWEWTTSNFGVWDTSARKLETSTPMKSIRGGAFDTYFDTQATCQFQSGESPINRKHNIGFRCALAMCDAISTAVSNAEDGGEELVACGAGEEETM